MSKYTYFSEEKALVDEFKTFSSSYGDKLVEYYLENGFDQLALDLHFGSAFQRQMLFDFLMVERKALLQCIRKNKPFFLKLITDGRGEMIRPMLGLTDLRFDGLWREALDLLSLYFSEKKVIEKMTNLELEKFFQSSIFGNEIEGNAANSEEK